MQSVVRPTAVSRALSATGPAALGVAALVSAAACQPLVAVTTAAGGGIAVAAVSSAPFPRYTSPYTVRVATPHVVKAPALTAYPWGWDQSWSIDSYGEIRRQCVSYAAWYLNSHGTPFAYFTKGPKGIATFANATDWDASARLAGFTVSRTPVVGSIAQWEKWEQSSWIQNGGTYNFHAGSFGHVGVVLKTYPDGTVDVAQYNLGDARNFSINRMRAPRYIYVPLSSPRVS